MRETNRDTDETATRLAEIIAALAEKRPELRALAGPPLPIRVRARRNSTYRIDTEMGSFALRIPPRRPVPFVDHSTESETAMLASRLGIGPELVHAEPNGIMLTRWSDALPLSAERIRSEPQAIRRVGETLRRLHRSARRLSRRFEVFAMIESYRQSYVSSTGGRDPWSPRLRSVVETARETLLRSPAPLVPSHCDLVPANCLDDGSRTLLVDWEYAGMNDPAWDLAYFALEGALNSAQQEVLLTSYNDDAISPERVQVFRLLCAALNHIWGLSRPEAAGADANPEWIARQIAIAESIGADERVEGWLASL
jgi:thiamine kinase-like enzyme